MREEAGRAGKATRRWAREISERHSWEDKTREDRTPTEKAPVNLGGPGRGGGGGLSQQGTTRSPLSPPPGRLARPTAPTKTRPRRGRRRSGRSSHGPRTAGLHFRGVFPASRLPLETRQTGGGTGGTQSRSRPRRAGAAMPRRPQRGKGVRSTTSSPRRAKQTNRLPPPPRRLHGAPAAPRQRRALSAGLRGPGRRAHAPHPRGRGQRHNVSSWCVRKMTPEKVSRGRARDRESGAGPSSRERTRRPPWRREPGPDRSPAAWGPAFRPPHSSEGAFLWGPGPAARWMSAVRPARVLSPARR